MRTTLEEVCFREVMNKVRVCERSSLDLVEVVHGMSDLHMEMANEMAMAVTTITVGTVVQGKLELMDRNKHREQSRRSEYIATALAFGDLSSRMERAAQQ